MTLMPTLSNLVRSSGTTNLSIDGELKCNPIEINNTLEVVMVMGLLQLHLSFDFISYPSNPIANNVGVTSFLPYHTVYISLA